MSHILEALQRIEARRPSPPPAEPVPRPSRVFRIRAIKEEPVVAGLRAEEEPADALPDEEVAIDPPHEEEMPPDPRDPADEPTRQAVADLGSPDPVVASETETAETPTEQPVVAGLPTEPRPEPKVSRNGEDGRSADRRGRETRAEQRETRAEQRETRAEQRTGYAQLAANLLARLPSEGPAVVLFTGPTDGVGTTSTLAPVAGVLAERVEGRVLAIDCNPYHPELADQFGVAARHDLAAVLSGSARWQDAVRATSLEGLSVLPATSRESATPLDPAALEPVLDDLRRHFALVLLDAASLGHPRTARLAAVCDGTCLVVRLGQTTRRQTEAAAAEIERHGGRLLGCVVTGVPAA